MPLRLDPRDVVVADLERAIPEIMNRYGIPGLSIALIRNHQIVWEKSFGIANTLTREPLTPETAMPMASIGKPLVAMAALSLVEDGALTLDGPLSEGVSTKWLPDSALRARISLRHILTHTSGFSNFLGDQTRAAGFPPGQRFSYSGVGFMYLQHILEAHSNRPLDSLTFRSVFEPLKMTKSWYGQGAERAARGNGHITFLRAVAPFGIIFVPAAFVALVIVWLVYWYSKKTKVLPWRLYLVVVLIAVIVTWWFLASKASDPGIVPFFIASGLFFLACCVLATFAAALTMQRLGLSHVIVRKIGVALGLVLLGTGGTMLRDFPVPVPDVTGPNGNAASSLHSTVGDIARFAIAMSVAENRGLIAQMATPQVPVSEHLQWGLGVGIQESDVGPAIFHWGRNPSMRAAFVLYLKSGIGAVVVVNLGDVGEAVTEVISRAIGGPLHWANE